MQITPHIHALKIPFRVTPPGMRPLERFAYVYFIIGDEICLIDSGVASSETMIFEYLQHMGRSPEEIALIILTHSHPDHIGAARAIRQSTGCKVAAHAAERLWIEDTERQERERPVPGFRTLVGGPVRVDYELRDGDRLMVGGDLGLEVFHTPGHSRGSISLLLGEEKALFSGDLIPVPGDLPLYEDPIASVRSIRRLQQVAGIRHLLSSWDLPKDGEDAYRAMEEGLRWLQRMHEAVLAADRNEADMMALCRQALCTVGLPGEAVNPLIAASCRAHLSFRNQDTLLPERDD
jgi:hydroxyacylglutathione hydrolase